MKSPKLYRLIPDCQFADLRLPFFFFSIVGIGEPEFFSRLSVLRSLFLLRGWREVIAERRIFKALLYNTSGGPHMDQNATIEEGEGRNGLELVRSVSDKHIDLLRPSARYYSMFKGQVMDAADREKGRYTLIRDEDYTQLGTYDKPLPCFGCGIGWFSFLVGFLCPLMWYYATILYFGNYYRKDPRERAGLAASAIAAMACSVILLIIVIILLV